MDGATLRCVQELGGRMGGWIAASRAWEAGSIRNHTPHHHTLFGGRGLLDRSTRDGWTWGR